MIEAVLDQGPCPGTNGTKDCSQLLAKTNARADRIKGHQNKGLQHALGGMEGRPGATVHVIQNGVPNPSRRHRYSPMPRRG